MHGLVALFKTPLFTWGSTKYPACFLLLTKQGSAWLPTEFYFCVGKANAKMPSTKQIGTASGNWTSGWENGSAWGGRAHPWLSVSCPDVELILPIWERLDNLEHVEKSLGLPFVLRRSSQFTVTAGSGFAAPSLQSLIQT